MEKVLLCFGKYENVTLSGQDGTTIKFPFSMIASSKVGTPEECQVTTLHNLIVGVSARIGWGDNENFLALALFAVGRQEVIRELYFKGDLSEPVTAFVPHGECPVDPSTLANPDGYIIEVKIPQEQWRCSGQANAGVNDDEPQPMSNKVIAEGKWKP